MFRQRQLCQRVIITFQADRGSVPDIMHDTDTIPGFLDAESVTRQNLTETLRVQLRESLTKLEFFPLDLYRTECPFLSLHGILRQIIGVDTQEITYPCFLQSQKTCYPVVTHHVHDILFHRTEYP